MVLCSSKNNSCNIVKTHFVYKTLSGVELLIEFKIALIITFNRYHYR